MPCERDSKSSIVSAGRCKQCNKMTRSLHQAAVTQGQSAYLEAVKKDPRQYRALLKAFQKEKLFAVSQRRKVKFHLTTFKVEYKTTHGKKHLEISRLMWEQEYLEWATKTAAGGYLSEIEATDHWAAMLKDPLVARDDQGPRGRIRLLVVMGSEVHSYSDMAASKALAKEARLGKNLTNKQLQDKMALLVSCAHAGL